RLAQRDDYLCHWHRDVLGRIRPRCPGRGHRLFIIRFLRTLVRLWFLGDGTVLRPVLRWFHSGSFSERTRLSVARKRSARYLLRRPRRWYPRRSIWTRLRRSLPSSKAHICVSISVKLR